MEDQMEYPSGRPTPRRAQQFVAAEVALAAFASAPAIAGDRFRSDVDAAVDSAPMKRELRRPGVTEA